MSERKSWDIQPKRRAAPALPPIERPQPAVRRTAPTTVRREVSRPQRHELRTQAKPRPMPEPQAQAIRRRTPVPQGKDREPLKLRRKRARTRSIWIVTILVLLGVAALFGSFWLGAVRIQGVATTGPDSDGVKSIAEEQLQGTYHYIIPRNSIFFFSEAEIRANILKQYPDISAVSISRTSLSTITISSIPREAALTWCGDTYSVATTSPQSGCYSADAQGVIFTPIDDSVGIPSSLRIYGPLADGGDSNPSPLGSVIAQANLIPNALQFIKAIKSLGVPIVAFAIRGDEADLYAQSGTRITYVLGHEEVTSQVAESAFPSLNLNDGSLEYVDLRFEGKAYFKKVGSVQASAATSTSGQ